MQPYDRHSDQSLRVRRFPKRGQRRHTRAVLTTFGRRQREAQRLAIWSTIRAAERAAQLTEGAVNEMSDPRNHHMWSPAYEIAVLEADLDPVDAGQFADWYVTVRWMDSVREALAEWQPGKVECTAQFATVAELTEHIRVHGCGSTEMWANERAWQHIAREASR